MKLHFRGPWALRPRPHALPGPRCPARHDGSSRAPSNPRGPRTVRPSLRGRPGSGVTCSEGTGRHRDKGSPLCGGFEMKVGRDGTGLRPSEQSWGQTCSVLEPPSREGVSPPPRPPVTPAAALPSQRQSPSRQHRPPGRTAGSARSPPSSGQTWRRWGWWWACGQGSCTGRGWTCGEVSRETWRAGPRLPRTAPVSVGHPASLPAGPRPIC